MKEITRVSKKRLIRDLPKRWKNRFYDRSTKSWLRLSYRFPRSEDTYYEDVYNKLKSVDLYTITDKALKEIISERHFSYLIQLTCCCCHNNNIEKGIKFHSSLYNEDGNLIYSILCLNCLTDMNKLI